MTASAAQPRSGWCIRRSSVGFSLVELLIVVGIIGLLVALLLPTVTRARLAATATQAHADLRSINLALTMYGMDHRRALPPSRFSCSSGATFPLPVELATAKYLPHRKQLGDDLVSFPDAFAPGQTYKYRVAGPAWVNETTFLKDASWLWVPDDAPQCQSSGGQWYNDAQRAPVRYAIWSEGPQPGRNASSTPTNWLPLVESAWYQSSRRMGVITHFVDRAGSTHMSP